MPGVVRAVVAWLLASIAFTACANAPDTLVPELEQRLAVGGPEKVNAYLASHWASAMIPLNRKAATCETRAVRLAVRLSRSRDARTAAAHADSIREALGVCTGFALSLVTREEVPKYCSSVASWSVMQTVRELRRRIAAIESDELLRAAPHAESCRAAYLHELQTTRVVLKAAPREPAR
jgi:glutamyl-tRNA reductase